MTPGLDKWTRLRILLVGLGMACLGLWLIGRFFYLQAIIGPDLREKAVRESQKLCPVLPVRGQILDCRGNELAISTRVYSLVAHPNQIENAGYFSRELAPVLGFDVRELQKIFTRARPFVWLQRHLSPEKEEAFRTWHAAAEKASSRWPARYRRDLDAIYLIPEAFRYYPQLTLAGPVLGFCNVDGQGLEGLELQYDKYLYGKPKKCMKMLDARGRIVVTGEKAWDPEVMGKNVVLTLDSTLQYIAEKELNRGVAHWKAASGLAMVVRPQTGEILAIAQSPGVDPNRFAQYRAENRHIRHLTYALEPGSTFKVFVAAAALDAHKVTPGDRFNCESGVYRLGPKEVIHDAHPYGTLTVQQIIQKSSNIGAAKIANRTGSVRLDRYLRAFGFGSRTGIAFPGESAGILKNLRLARSPIDRATLAFGQGVSVTALQLTMALAALGNSGVLMEPLLVKKIVSPGGKVVQVFQPHPIRRVIAPATAKQMLAIMQTVTQPGGTAKEAAPPGFAVAGKTGTAQKLVGRSYSHNKYMSLFIGLIPAQKPELAIAVIVDEPKGAYYGGVVAAPIFREIAAQSLRFLGVYPQGENQPVLAGILPSLGAARASAASEAPPPEAAPLPKPKKLRSPVPQKRLKVMPDLNGLTLRQALNLLHPTGLHCRFEGSGRAYSQDPAPGAAITPATTCSVKFRAH
ncbi:MAG: penicillin-binding protein [Syntrophales bacterium]|nr:penicillin-binding protein [Syntrophales bacterium]MDD5642800.1 penicillin-binding protein [Syntrophales bacterium]